MHESYENVTIIHISHLCPKIWQPRDHRTYERKGQHKI